MEEDGELEHYFTEAPKAKYREFKIKAKVRGFDLVFKSATGVFSARDIDNASQLLIEKAELPKSGKILDLGCGYGLLGIVAAKVCPNCQVVLTDINRRAVKLAIQNLKQNEVKNAEVRHGNIYEPVAEEKFDVILLNPPMAAGREVVLQMIYQAPEHLNKGGSLQIVARKTKGGEFLFGEMKKIFSEVKVLAKSGGFWVVKGVK